MPGQPSYPTDLGTIGYAIQATIAAGTTPTIAASKIIFSPLIQPFPVVGYPQVVIARGNFAPVPGWYEGGGRYTSCLTGLIRITINTMDAQDEFEQDKYRTLGNPTTNPPIAGLELISLQVMNALHEQFLEDTNGNFLIVEPLKIEGSAEPQDYGKVNPQWEGISLSFRVMYLPNYTLPGIQS